MDWLYEAQQLSFAYGGRTVLDIAELRLRRGSLYTVSGANGAGKSTLLQLLAFLTLPADGVLRFAGVGVNNRELMKLRRRVTLLGQSPYLLRGSVRDNLEYGLKVRGLEHGERRRRIDAALAEVGLEDFAERRASALSGGEQQRVALARALALQPEVLLLDEPCASLDAASVARIETVLRSLPQRGTSVILVTHDPQQHRRLQAENLHLSAGRLTAGHSLTSPLERVPCLSPLTLQEA